MLADALSKASLLLLEGHFHIEDVSDGTARSASQENMLLFDLDLWDRRHIFRSVICHSMEFFITS
jgi:hypothetical protein